MTITHIGPLSFSLRQGGRLLIWWAEKVSKIPARAEKYAQKGLVGNDKSFEHLNKSVLLEHQMLPPFFSLFSLPNGLFQRQGNQTDHDR